MGGASLAFSRMWSRWPWLPVAMALYGSPATWTGAQWPTGTDAIILSSFMCSTPPGLRGLREKHRAKEREREREDHLIGTVSAVD